jgi:hypothetical protein
MFFHDPSSLILPELKHNATGMCVTGFMAKRSEPFILGDVFLQGMVTVFDISEKMEMRFAKRLD